MLPSPGAIPAEVANHTGVPAGTAAVPCSTTPTPWTPGTYGVAGTPKYDVPVAQSRSSGAMGAALTRIVTSPGRGDGGSRRRTAGGSPGVSTTTASWVRSVT